MDDCALGSSLIALETGHGEGRSSDLPFTRVLSMDLDAPSVDALKARTAAYGSRSVVEEGDCNVDLIPLMKDQIPARQPLLVFLDPQAFEVKWSLVEAVSRFRGDRPTEMLLLVNPTAVLRVLGVGGAVAEGQRRAFPPESSVEAVAQDRQRGLITPATAKYRIVESFVEGLRGLGYREPVSRAITHPGSNPCTAGGEVYHLVFASASPAGNNIMGDAFDKIYTNQPEPIDTGQLEMELGIDTVPPPELPGAFRFNVDEDVH